MQSERSKEGQSPTADPSNTAESQIQLPEHGPLLPSEDLGSILGVTHRYQQREPFSPGCAQPNSPSISKSSNQQISNSAGHSNRDLQYDSAMAHGASNAAGSGKTRPTKRTAANKLGARPQSRNGELAWVSTTGVNHGTENMGITEATARRMMVMSSPWSK